MRRHICFLMLLPLLLLLILATVDGNPKAKAISREPNASSTKSSEKMGYPKKVNSTKKRPLKSPLTAEGTTGSGEGGNATDFTDDLKQLGADDLEFIAAVEKQFTMYGGKIRFKVERDNSTTDSKNPKRTVEGELGYGYSQAGYEYRKPAFVFYPYSQKDIPPEAPGYYPGHQASSITVQPSYSYELQPQKYQIPAGPQVDLPSPSAQAYQDATGPSESDHQQPSQTQSQETQHQPLEQSQTQQQQYQQQQQDGNYDGPVIVLRIPGPAKYAARLQTLLQRYLQIRATQYLHLLEGSAQKGEYQSPEYAQHQSYAGEVSDAVVAQHPQYDIAQYAQSHSSLGEGQQQHYEQISTPVSQPGVHSLHQHYEVPQYEHTASSGPSVQHHHHKYEEAPQYVEHTTLSSYQHSHVPTSHSVSYPDIGDVYQNYKNRHQHQPQIPEHIHQSQHQQQHEISTTHVQADPEYCPEEEGYNIPSTVSAPSYYYPHHHSHHDHYESTGHLSTNIHQPHNYQSVYLYSVPSAPIYADTSGITHVPHHQHSSSSGYAAENHLLNYDPHQLRTTENNPRMTHTQVLFTPQTEAGDGAHETMYALPSIRPYDRHPPAPVINKQYYQSQHQQQYLQQQQQGEQQHEIAQNEHQRKGTSENAEHRQQPQVNYQQSENSSGRQISPQGDNLSKQPYNYHAHPERGPTLSKNKRDYSAASTPSSFRIISLSPLRESNKFEDKIKSKISPKAISEGE